MQERRSSIAKEPRFVFNQNESQTARPDIVVASPKSSSALKKLLKNDPEAIGMLDLSDFLIEPEDSNRFLSWVRKSVSGRTIDNNLLQKCIRAMPNLDEISFGESHGISQSSWQLMSGLTKLNVLTINLVDFMMAEGVVTPDARQGVKGTKQQIPQNLPPQISTLHIKDKRFFLQSERDKAKSSRFIEEGKEILQNLEERHNHVKPESKIRFLVSNNTKNPARSSFILPEKKIVEDSQHSVTSAASSASLHSPVTSPYSSTDHLPSLILSDTATKSPDKRKPSITWGDFAEESSKTGVIIRS